MNRSVVRSALGRGRLEAARSSISQYPTSTPRHFSTTAERQADEDSGSRSSAQPSGQSSQDAASKPAFRKVDHNSAPRPARLDARNLAASPTARGGPKVISIRTLGSPLGRGALGAPRGGGGGGGARQPRLGRDGEQQQQQHPRMSSAFQKFMAGSDRAGGGGVGGRGRFARGAGGGRGSGGRGGGGGMRGGGGRAMGDRKKGPRKNDQEDERFQKLTWSKEEQDFINANEQGVVLPYTPSATLADYAGYGPAIATNSPLGKVESAVRSMRILGGGRPFCADTYMDDKGTLKRYREEKKPVFFDDVKEKEWLVEMTGHRLAEEGIRGPDERTKRAIVETAVQGKYPAPRFAELRNTMEALANYHTKQDTWMPTDAQAFDEKVRSLLPAVAAKGPAAKSAKKAKA